MSKASLFNNIKNFVAKHYGANTGKMLIHTGVIGWVLSSAAQVTAIVINDKIPNEQKMYLIPQEIADAAVNIISFYTITQTFSSVAKKLVTSGKLLPKSVKDWITSKSLLDKIGKSTSNIYNAGLSASAKKRLDIFKEGIDVIATTIGSILSCNIVTPIVRNEIAAKRQKKAITRITAKNSELNSVNIYSNNLTKSFIKKPTMQSFQAGTYSKLYSNNSSSLTV